MNKLCTVCHKKEAVWDNFGGICSECFIEKETKANRVKHDTDLLAKVAERIKSGCTCTDYSCGTPFNKDCENCSNYMIDYPSVIGVINELKAEVEKC